MMVKNYKIKFVFILPTSARYLTHTVILTRLQHVSVHMHHPQELFYPSISENQQSFMSGQ